MQTINARQQEEKYYPIDDNEDIEQTSNTQNPFDTSNLIASHDINNRDSYKTRSEWLQNLLATYNDANLKWTRFFEYSIHAQILYLN